MTTLADLSQLTKSMVKKSVEEPKPAPKPKAQDSPVDREAAEVMAYFARPGGNAPQRPHVASRADPAKDRAVELEAALEAKDAAPGCWRVCWRLTLRPANSNVAFCSRIPPPSRPIHAGHGMMDAKGRGMR